MTRDSGNVGRFETRLLLVIATWRQSAEVPLNTVGKIHLGISQRTVLLALETMHFESAETQRDKTQ
jgi:hypothetical protein